MTLDSIKRSFSNNCYFSQFFPKVTKKGEFSFCVFFLIGH